MMTVVDAQRDRRERLSWVSLSPESSVWVSTRTTSPHRRNESSSTALEVEVLQEDVVHHQQGARVDGGEHSWAEGKLHQLVGARDL
jgi:hypothetical protein